MRRFPLSCSISAIFVALSLAGCSTYSNNGSGNGPIAPYINTQPANQTVTTGQTATFSVAATGTTPLTYQWQKNGADIANATSSSYATPVPTPSDRVDLLRLQASN